MTNLKPLLASFAVAFAVSAWASPPVQGAAPAKEASGDAAPASKKPSTGTAKAGEACKADGDCDQNAGSQKCVKSKCQRQPEDRIPPPTT